MKVKETVDYKAAAAAKLLLQELDPVARRKRQEFSSGKPQGLLAIHAKNLCNFSKTFFFTSTFAGCSEIRLFLRITIQDTIKCTKIVHIRRDGVNNKTKIVLHRQSKLCNRKSVSHNSDSQGRPSVALGNSQHRDSLAYGNAEIVLDELKTFSLLLSPKQDDPCNDIKFELIEIDSPGSVQRRGMLNLGEATISIFDLVKEMYGPKQIVIMAKDKQIANVDVEFVFRYGALGYGYSHQLQQDEHPVSTIMSESMFYKVDGPIERKDEEGFLEASDTPHPSFIPFVNPSKSENSINKSTDLFFDEVPITNLTELISKRRRLLRLRNEYLDLSTRHDRTAYLERLVAKLGVGTVDGNTSHDDDLEMNGNDDGSPRQLAGLSLDSRRQSEAVKAVVENLSPLLLMASGLQQRGSRGGVVRKRATFEDMESNEKTELEESTSSQQTLPTALQVPVVSPKIDAPEKKGFLKILKKKVIVPMKLRKMLEHERSNANSDSKPTTSDNSRP